MVLHPHALRHRHATDLIEAGVPIKAAQKRLGHVNIRTLLDVCVHAVEGDESATAVGDVLARVIE